MATTRARAPRGGATAGRDDAWTTGERASGQRRTTLTFDIVLTVRTNLRASSSNPGTPGPTGFDMTLTAPARSASSDVAISRVATEVLTMTTGVGTSNMMRLVASKPSMPGMTTSMTMTSGRSLRASETASSPSFASPTTVISGSLRRSRTSRMRAVGESSTTSARIMVFTKAARSSRAADPCRTRS